MKAYLEKEKTGMKESIRRLILLLLIIPFCTGCVDVVHYVGKEENDLFVNLRITLQKMVFQSMAEMSGEEVSDDYFRGEFGMTEDAISEELPPYAKATLTEVNTQFDFGYDISMYVEEEVYDALSETEEVPFFPAETEKGFQIVIPSAGADTEDDSEMAAAFLMSAKYRLIVSKELISEYDEIFIKADYEAYVPSVKEFPDIFIIEFPLAFWFLSENDLVVHLY
jgi:hypothetical protein